MGKQTNSTDYLNRLFSQESWYSFYFNQLSNIVYQIFEWENLPKTIEPRFLERFLHSDGHVAFWEHPLVGKMVFSGSFTEISPYQEPLRFQSNILSTLSHFNQVNFPLHTYIDNIEESRIENKGIFCSNMFSHLGGSQGLFSLGDNSLNITSSLNAIDRYSLLLAENKLTYLVASQNLKMPFVVHTTKENELTARNFIKNIQQNKATIFIDKELSLDSGLMIHQTLPAGYVNIIEKLEFQRKNYLQECLNYFGIYSFSSDKKERLVSGETKGSVEETNHNLNKFLEPRKQCAELLNQLWNLDGDAKISVKVRSNINQLIASEFGIDENNPDYDPLSAEN